MGRGLENIKKKGVAEYWDDLADTETRRHGDYGFCSDDKIIPQPLQFQKKYLLITEFSIIDYYQDSSHGDSNQILGNRINPCYFVSPRADQRYILWGQFPPCPYTVGFSLNLAFCLLL